MIRGFANRLRGWLQSRYLPWWMAALAMLLCAPSLWLGWQTDDHFHRASLTRPEWKELSRSPVELFAYIKGEAHANRQAVAIGHYPWWTSEHLRLAFLRPLAGLTHGLDYWIWPLSPWTRRSTTTAT